MTTVVVGDQATRDYLAAIGQTVQDALGRSSTPTTQDSAIARATIPSRPGNQQINGINGVIDAVIAGTPLGVANRAGEAVAGGAQEAIDSVGGLIKRIAVVGLGAALIITGLILSKGPGLVPALAEATGVRKF